MLGADRGDDDARALARHAARAAEGPARARRATAATVRLPWAIDAGSGAVEGKTKFIFITGGVVSSLGKGITAASLGALLKARGLKVGRVRSSTRTSTSIRARCRPYQHGEVFVTRRRRARPTSTSGTTSASSTRTRRARRTTPRAASTTPSSARSARASTSARRCRSSRTSPTRSRRAILRARPFAGPRRRAGRDRRHGRRHREPAVPRGDPPAAHPARPRQRLLRARDPGAADRGRRRAEDEADAALRQRAAPHRYLARRRGLPLARARSRASCAARSPSSPTSTSVP